MNSGLAATSIVAMVCGTVLISIVIKAIWGQFDADQIAQLKSESDKAQYYRDELNLYRSWFFKTHAAIDSAKPPKE